MLDFYPLGIILKAGTSLTMCFNAVLEKTLMEAAMTAASSEQSSICMRNVCCTTSF